MDAIAKGLNRNSVFGAMRPDHRYTAAVLSKRLGFATVPALQELAGSGLVLIVGQQQGGVRVWMRAS